MRVGIDYFIRITWSNRGWGGYGSEDQEKQKKIDHENRKKCLWWGFVFILLPMIVAWLIASSGLSVGVIFAIPMCVSIVVGAVLLNIGFEK